MTKKKIYEYENIDERKAIYREQDKIKHFIKYWEKHYNIKVPVEKIQWNKTNKPIIKKCLPILKELGEIEFINNNNLD